MVVERFGSCESADQLVYDVIKSGSWVGEEKWQFPIKDILLYLCTRYVDTR